MSTRLHHMAFRCRDTEETRAFYEEVLGIPLAAAVPIEKTATGREARALHSFFALRDGSFIAFFEVPDQPFDFAPQHDFNLHLALEADQADVDRATAEARRRGLEVRGPSDHGFISSTYFRDPNGYVVEFAVKSAAHAEFERDEPRQAHEVLRAWRERIAAAPAA